MGLYNVLHFKTNKSASYSPISSFCKINKCGELNASDIISDKVKALAVGVSHKRFNSEKFRFHHRPSPDINYRVLICA